MKLDLPTPFPQAFGTGLIVLPQSAEEHVTEGGIILPDSPTTKKDTDSPPQKIGVVCHVGPDVKLMLIDPTTNKQRNVQQGDLILYPAFYDTGFDWKGTFYISMSSLDVKNFLPSNEAKPIGASRKSRKRAAIANEDSKLL